MNNQDYMAMFTSGYGAGPAAKKIGGQGLMDFLFGTGFQKMDTMTPEQQQFLSQIMSQLNDGQLGQGYVQGLSGLMGMMDPSSAAYQRFEQPYMKQFNEQTVPQLAERFAGAGAQGGALSSSGFGQALSSAGSQLQTSLAGMKAGLQQNAIRDILNQYKSMAGIGLGAQPFGYQQPQQGFVPGIFNSFAQGAGKAMGGL
jgi:hypothetical protein